MDPKTKAVEVIRGMMSELETDVSQRNTYMNRRYNVVYDGGIMTGLRIKMGHDMTPYNYLPRVVDVHSAQLFGRMPQIMTDYNKEDLAVYEVGVTDEAAAKTEKEKARLRNTRRATDAEVRNEAIRNIMLDNNFEEMINLGATVGSWSGITVIKGWLDRDAETYKFSLLEQPQNFMRYWANSNFREHDADFYSYQISINRANRLYRDKLAEGESFSASSPGQAWWRAQDAKDLEKLTIKKVWVVDATGYFPGVCSKNGELATCKPGDENEINVLIVGDKIVQVIDKDVPTYTVVNNEDHAGKPWGRSDVSDELISVNQTMIETMSDWRTASWKITFPKMKFMGFDALDMPGFEERTAQGIPVGLDQDILPINMENTLAEFPRLMSELWNSFTKLGRMSRVMLDDPTLNPVSNQGLMTTMKPLIDVTEGKQKRWTTALTKMFGDALNGVAELDPAYKEAVKDHDWKVKVKWPSVYRIEDATYQQMYANRWSMGTISPESYLEAMGVDAGEEIDRIRDAMEDPLRASMLGRGLPQMAGHTLNKSLGIPPQGYLQTKVQLRGELAPSEVGNLGHTYGLDTGPYGDTVGPQGQAGAAANANFVNSGMLNGNPFDGGTANYQAPNPTLTADQNTGGQPVSQPGSGAPAVSPQGAINQVNQHAGK